MERKSEVRCLPANVTTRRKVRQFPGEAEDAVDDECLNFRKSLMLQNAMIRLRLRYFQAIFFLSSKVGVHHLFICVYACSFGFSALSGVLSHVVMLRPVLGIFDEHRSVSCCICPGLDGNGISWAGSLCCYDGRRCIDKRVAMRW